MAAIRTAISRSGGVRQAAVRAGVIDGGRELVRQHLGELVDRNVEARRELLDGVAAEHLLQLFGRNRQVLAVADPRFDLIAKPALLKLGDDRRQSTLAAIAKHLAQHHRNHGSFELTEHALERIRIFQ